MPAVDVNVQATLGCDAGIVAKDVLQFLARSSLWRILQHPLPLDLTRQGERPLERIAEKVRAAEPERALFERRHELGKVNVPPEHGIRRHIAIERRWLSRITVF